MTIIKQRFVLSVRFHYTCKLYINAHCLTTLRSSDTILTRTEMPSLSPRRSETHRLSFNHGTSCFWRSPSLQVILLCIAVSTLFQVIGPLFHFFSTNVVCRKGSFFNEELKIWIFQCPS